MPVNEEIIALLKQEYADFDDFPDEKRSIPSFRFKCDCKEKCDIKLEEEASYTPLLGDNDSNYMIVAESPSKAQGAGCFLGGKSKNAGSKKRTDNISLFLEYIKKINGSKYPYFTDMVKCGLKKTNFKEKLNLRRDNCVNKFLIKEIEIVKPKTIVCLGSDAYKVVDSLKKKKKINSSIKVVQVMHYSNRASLTMSIQDKKDVIWPIELGLLSADKARDAIVRLKHLVKKIENLKGED